MNNKITKLPFESRYIKERILNYGKAYTNYKTYQIMNINSNIKNNENNETNKNNENNKKIKDNIAFIYVDNQQCSYQVEKPLPSELSTNALYYIEIHYTLESKLSVLETIMKENEIEELLGKYVYVLIP